MIRFADTRPFEILKTNNIYLNTIFLYINIIMSQIKIKRKQYDHTYTIFAWRMWFSLPEYFIQMCIYQLDKYIYVIAFFCTLPSSLGASIFFIPRRRRCFSPLLLLPPSSDNILSVLLTCYYSNPLGDHRVSKSLDIGSLFTKSIFRLLSVIIQRFVSIAGIHRQNLYEASNIFGIRTWSWKNHRWCEEFYRVLNALNRRVHIYQENCSSRKL